MRRSLPLFIVFVVACSNSAGVGGTTTTESSTTTQSPETSTTTEATTTTSSTTTTTLPPTFDFDYVVRVYDLFEPAQGSQVELDAPCIAIGDLNGLRAQARIVVRDDSDSSVGSAQMSPGTIRYDDSGPVIGEGQDDLFYYCAFDVELRDLSLTDDGAYRIEFPIGMTSDVIALDDFQAGVGTSFSQQNFEDERQRIRSG